MNKKIKVTNNRGLSLAGIAHIPEKISVYPFMILLHGFTGYKEEKHIEGLAKYLEANSIGSVCFDASGSGESEGSMEVDYRVTNYLNDIETVYNFVKLNFSVERERIGIWGHSMGGQMAILFAERHQELKCVSVVAPVLELTKTLWLKPLAAEWERSGWLGKISSRGGMELKIPWSFVQDASQYEALSAVRLLSHPIQFIVGLSDDTVNPIDVKILYKEACEPKTLVEIPEMSHDYKKFPDQIYVVNNHVMEFLRKYL